MYIRPRSNFPRRRAIVAAKLQIMRQMDRDAEVVEAVAGYEGGAWWGLRFPWLTEILYCRS
jgi:hypothetical protein